jgi:hypothetical protein
MEVDTGASVSLMSELTFKELLQGRVALTPYSVKLKTYTGQAVSVLGQASVRVQVSRFSDCVQLPLLVVADKGPSLLGRDWLKSLQLNWQSVKKISDSDSSEVIHEFPEVFAGLGKFQGQAVSIAVKEDARPRFFKARPVPLALRPKVEQQLRKEVDQGILHPVKSCDWASPIVPVMKTEGSIRVCADFKQTVNLAIWPDTYPLPNIDELFARLSGGRKFSKLDLSQAFSQLPLDSAAQDLCTINTSLGLLRYTRLPFGISTAPSVFQRVMDGLLQGIEHCAAFIDDVIVTGEDDESHKQNLRAVLQVFKEAGLTCNESKCSFSKDSVAYLGHRIDAEGLHPLEDKVLAEPLPPEMRVFELCVDQLSVHDGCVLWGNRVVIPEAGRARLLDCLHQGHPGASRMKSFARNYFWWPGMDMEIESKAATCNECQQHRRAGPPAQLRPWPLPSGPWTRVHVDYAGPVQGRMLLVVVDAFSKWLDVHVTSSTTTSVTTEKLRQSFCTHGLPEVIVSDNGPCFPSEEFDAFCSRNGIRHIRTPPYHPASNGQAERAVQTIKNSLKKQVGNGSSVSGKSTGSVSAELQDDTARYDWCRTL